MSNNKHNSTVVPGRQLCPQRLFCLAQRLVPAFRDDSRPALLSRDHSAVSEILFKFFWPCGSSNPARLVSITKDGY
jgi:hypothetical protein